jgi:8-oxo-dGTP diphosphatase
MRVSTEPLHVGAELVVRKGNQILLGLRKNIYGAGTWGLPGGHPEHNERMVDAICREAKEEIGFALKPSDVRLACVTDGLIQKDGERHYIHITFEMHDPQTDPQLMEPDECDAWQYFDLASLPDNLFLPHVDIIENYKQQRLYDY